MCHRLRAKVYRKTNYAKVREIELRYRSNNREKDIAYRQANKTKIAAYHASRYTKHRAAILKQNRAYYYSPVGKIGALLRWHRRRARIHSATVEIVSLEFLRVLFRTFDGKCAWCRKRAATTLDHIVPLVKGGLHARHNLAPACKPCNSTKAAKSPEQWARACGVRLSSVMKKVALATVQSRESDGSVNITRLTKTTRQSVLCAEA